MISASITSMTTNLHPLHVKYGGGCNIRIGYSRHIHGFWIREFGSITSTSDVTLIDPTRPLWYYSLLEYGSTGMQYGIPGCDFSL
jgi:uncharacterized protein YneR